MSLVSIVQSLQKMPLTSEQVESLNEFQKVFGVANDDPLLVVLAMMSRSQLILENAPDLLQQKVDSTIELHRVVLREQAVAISKELIADLSAHIYNFGANTKKRWLMYLAFFSGGAVTACVMFALIKLITAH
ncbi:MAG: hypothetical protein V4713_03685 [Pseudomonadota bacterium]